MTPEQFLVFKNDIQAHIADTVRLTVNGKIDKINTKLDTFMKEDLEWKARAQPILDLGANVRGFNKGLVYLLGILGMVGAGWVVITFVAKSILNK